MSNKLRVAIVGISGLTGGEACRLLLGHPEVTSILGIARAPASIGSMHPQLRGAPVQVVDSTEIHRLPRIDLALMCVPTGEASRSARSLLAQGIKIIDLSADFRFRSAELYRETHGVEHGEPSLLGAPYAAIELVEPVTLTGSSIVSNPGCYAIGVLLALAPLAAEGLIAPNPNIVIHAVNGTSGADLSSPALAHPRATTTVPYDVDGHRHVPEIVEQLNLIAGMCVPSVDMTCAHGSFPRGISLQISAPPVSPGVDARTVNEALADFYADRGPFIQIVHQPDRARRGQDGPRQGKDYARYPQPAHVIGSNSCHFAGDIDRHTGRIRIVGALDNLGKGAAGNAIQAMNIMFGFDPALGLSRYGL